MYPPRFRGGECQIGQSVTPLQFRELNRIARAQTSLNFTDLDALRAAQMSLSFGYAIASETDGGLYGPSDHARVQGVIAPYVRLTGDAMMNQRVINHDEAQSTRRRTLTETYAHGLEGLDVAQQFGCNVLLTLWVQRRTAKALVIGGQQRFRNGRVIQLR